MTLKQAIQNIVLEAADKAQSLDVVDLMAREKTRTANCPGCARMFIKQTNSEIEYCMLCAGEDE